MYIIYLVSHKHTHKYVHHKINWIHKKRTKYTFSKNLSFMFPIYCIIIRTIDYAHYALTFQARDAPGHFHYRYKRRSISSAIVDWAKWGLSFNSTNWDLVCPFVRLNSRTISPTLMKLGKNDLDWSFVSLNSRTVSPTLMKFAKNVQNVSKGSWLLIIFWTSRDPTGSLLEFEEWGRTVVHWTPMKRV